jgi:CubicO group peptidase (beta-lactamase class C family)
LGSITKSITATMIARLVESGQLKWTDTIGERFPDASIHGDWKPVTLQQLLTHTSGAPANFSLGVRLKEPALGPKCTRERRKAVIDVIAEKPAHRRARSSLLECRLYDCRGDGRTANRRELGRPVKRKSLSR